MLQCLLSEKKSHLRDIARCCLSCSEQVTDRGGLIRMAGAGIGATTNNGAYSRADPTGWTWGKKGTWGVLETMEEEARE